MKNTLAMACVALAIAGPAYANKTSYANIEDHYKTVIQQSPYKVEVCRDVQVPTKGANTFDKDSAIIGGIIGGIIGNQVGKGSGKEAATGVGALTGAIIGGNKQGPTTYTTQRQCEIETRYKETQKEVYSHSTVTFSDENGRSYTLSFQKK